MEVDGQEVASLLEEASQGVTVILHDGTDEEEEPLPSTYSPEEDAHRLELYHYAWQICHERIKDILAEQHAADLRRIVDYVKATREPSIRILDLGLPSPLPTALVVGANQASAQVISAPLSALDDYIIVQLNSRECPTAKAAARTLITRVIDTADPPDESAPKVGGRKPSMLAQDDMMLLEAFYRYHCEVREERRSIVVIFEDFEGFGAHVVAELLYVLRLHSRTLPFVLIFGISTSVEVLHRSHFPSTLSLIKPEIFTLDSGADTFHALVQGLFLSWSEAPVDIDVEVCSALRSGFEDLDLSIDSFISKVQHIYLSHFLTSPFALATLSLDGEAPTIDATPPLDRYLLAPSLSSLDALPPIDASSLYAATDSSVALSQLLDDSLQHRRTAVEARCRALRVLNVLRQTWRDGKMGDGELVRRYFDNELGKEITRLTGYLRKTNDDTLRQLLGQLVDEMPDEGDYATWLERLDGLISRRTLAHLVNGNELGGSVVTDADRAFTSLIFEVATQLSDSLKTALSRPDDMIIRFSEVYTCTDALSLSQTFYPSLQGSVTTSLGSTYDRLLDAGKIVNLADWYASLPSEEREKASFVREVSALSWMGFVGQTKRKTEHVARLIW